MEIKYSKQAIKFIKKQDKPTRNRLYDAINSIPLGDIIRLSNSKNYRLRLGEFRIIFDKQGNVAYIMTIDNRGEIYSKKHKQKRGK